MRRYCLTAAGLLLVLTIPAAAVQLHPFPLKIANEIEYGLSSVSGPGSSFSTLSSSGRYVNTLSLTSSTDSDGFRSYFNLSGRLTNDRTVLDRTFSLSSLQAKFSWGSQDLCLGDTMESFSQYTLSSALKGLSYTLRGAGPYAPAFTGLYGLGYAGWDNFGDLESARREVYGLSARQQLNAEWSGGIHLVRSFDSNRVNAADPLYRGTVTGLTWAFEPFEGLSLTGESSMSSIDESPSAGNSTNRKSGSAHRIAFRGAGDGLRLDADYERAATDFLTVLGSVSPDREKARVRWTQNYDKNTTAYYTMLWFRDNLDGKKGQTTHQYRPEIRFTHKRLFDRRYAVADLTWKLDQRNGSSSDTNHFVDIGYRDRFEGIDTDTRMGLASYMTTGGVRRSNEYTFNTTFSTRRTFDNIVVRPNVHLGTRMAGDELTSGYERVYEASAGSGVDIPDINVTSKIQLGHHNLLRKGGDNKMRNFANLSVYCTPGLSDGSKPYTFVLRWLVNDFTGADSSRNYQENSLVAGINFQY